MNHQILESINQASKIVGNTWPLYSFVASNPLAGYENKSFEEVATSLKEHLNANILPEPKILKQAYENGEIDKNLLRGLLKEEGFNKTPESYLTLVDKYKRIEKLNHYQDVDQFMTKWLSAFLDEGLAEWDMPYKNEGFYSAWRRLVVYDSSLAIQTIDEIPETSEEALEQTLSSYSPSEYLKIFKFHLGALPGWTGYINHRNQSNTDWQKQYPISLKDYLAVRLWLTKKINLEILPEVEEDCNEEVSKIQYLLLKAWEETWQNKLFSNLESNLGTTISNHQNPLDAQFVFCIDTRSELIRRHIEARGNYETFGYAGFFGITMDYVSPYDGISRKSCPPIVDSAFKVSEHQKPDMERAFLKFKKKTDILAFRDYFLKRMKNMLPSTFGFVEGSGFFYGLYLIARTFIPGKIYQLASRKKTLESICDPNLEEVADNDDKVQNISLDKKVGIVKSAFDLMGWREFAPLVLFVGHGSHSANNPYSSSLDCGACAANPGRHNARMLAKLANSKEVRMALAKDHNLIIPEATFFIGAEHNTTTDRIELFDSNVPDSHKQKLENLKEDLFKAQQNATQERLGVKSNSISLSQIKASDWGETRPEWGLAKNAGFIVGPRSLTKNLNLEGRCFLHSYDWKLDSTGKFLEGIMQGPMVVTQWINNHYYFSTVDNQMFGGGSKITQNITGRFGVVQGNGGDLKMGLPLQSLFASDSEMYHQPLRLTVVIQAPISRISEILINNKNLKNLLDNEWIYLMVMDPQQENEIFKYEKSLKWFSKSEKKLQKVTKTNQFENELVSEFSF